MRKTLSFILVLLMTLVLAVYSTPAMASPDLTPPQGYPRRPIELVCPFGPAGASDIACRTIAEIMKDYIPMPVNVVNKPGGGTATGLTYANSQRADGYTIFFATPSPLIIEAQGLTPISVVNDFVPIGNLQIDVIILSVHKDNKKFQNLEELIEYAKKNPGDVTVGGQSPRGLDDYTTNAFGDAAGIKLSFVPYDSAAEQKSAFLGREIDVYLDKVPSLMTMIDNKDVVPFIVLHDRRLSEVAGFENIPCTIEKGIECTQGSWRGLSFKKGTPQEIVDYMEKVLHQVYLSDKYQERAKLDNSNIIPGYMNAEDAGKSWKAQLEGFKEIFSK